MSRGRCGVVLLLGLAAPLVAATRVEMPVFEGGEGMDFFFDCARAYERARPGTEIDLSGDPRIADKARVRVLEGTFPEVTNAGLNYWALIKHGDVLPLDEFLDKPNWEGDRTWRQSFFPGSLDRYQYKGKVYGLPLASFVQCLWYNKRMFREHGWAPPATWPELLSLCGRIKDAGIAPMAFQGQYHGYAMMLIDGAYYSQVGRARFDAQKNLEPGSFDNPELRKALELVGELATQYFQPGAMGMSHTQAQTEFFLGHTAMIPCGSWLKSEMLGKIPAGFKMGAFNFPVVPGGMGDPTAINTVAGYYFVFRKSQHPREGVDFLRFMTSREQAGRFCRSRDIPVAVQGVNEQNLSADVQDLAAIIKAAGTSYGQVPGEGYPEMDQYWTDARFGILTGKITPEQACRDLEEAAGAVRERKADPDRVTVRHVAKPATLLALLLAAAVYWLVTTLRALRQRRARAGIERTGLVRLSLPNVLLFVGPAVLLYTILVVVPCLRSFAWCVHEWDGLTTMRYVGLLYFRRLLFEDDAFWTALRNNLFLMIVVPLFVLPLSLFLAACLSHGVRGSRLFRVCFFFPNILGAVATTLLWMHLYNPKGGPVNAAVVGLGKGLTAAHLGGLGHLLTGFDGFTWLSPDHLYWALIPMSGWGACGFNMVLFLAAMESIPQSIYEAADLDGATPWQKFWHLTVPLIWDVLSISIVFMVIGGMKAFESIWLLTQSMFTEFKVGEATAIGVPLFLMVFLGTAATLRLMKRETVEM
ncbi:MAG: extracellular solute-binding protein [Armatimonadetes bacterium]|nr:extracellular solute-binding protein [Armatimonadota bacterium]